MTEQWKDIPGFEGLYSVSDQGRVKGRYKEFLSACPAHEGYLMVSCFKGNKRKVLSLHRLVAALFLPNPGNLPLVRHKNGDKTDNRVENLEWHTYTRPSKGTMYRQVPGTIDGLECTPDGEFRLNGYRKKVVFCHTVSGQKATARIQVRRDGTTRYWQAARLVARTWLPDYEDTDYITYRDGDCHNISRDNLHIADKREYWKYMQRNSSMKPATLEERKKKLQLIIDEASITLHYFKTLDMEPFNKHVRDHLYPCLMRFAIKTAQMGERKALDVVPEVIAILYDKVMQGFAIYNHERFCKKYIMDMKRKGTYGEYWHKLCKPIQIEVEQLNLDCLWERYKVTRLKRAR